MDLMESLKKDWDNNEQKWTNNKVLRKTGTMTNKNGQTKIVLKKTDITNEPTGQTR